MNLPDLPVIRKKREAGITPKVLAWFHMNHPDSCVIEIKVAKGKTIPESALLPHQRLALLAASGKGLTHKLSDEARRQQPFDAFHAVGVKAYVVACFLDRPRVGLAIDVKKWRGAHRGTSCDFTIDL